MSMPRIKILILDDGQHIWFPSESDLIYHDEHIVSVWIEEELTYTEFEELRKKRVFLKNKS